MSIEEIAAANPCVRFIVDNYEMLCRVHGGKVVLVLNKERPACGPDAYVAGTFQSMISALAYTEAIDMREVPYALKQCDGEDPYSSLVYSNACKGA